MTDGRKISRATLTPLSDAQEFFHGSITSLLQNEAASLFDEALELWLGGGAKAQNRATERSEPTSRTATEKPDSDDFDFSAGVKATKTKIHRRPDGTKEKEIKYLAVGGKLGIWREIAFDKTGTKKVSELIYGLENKPVTKILYSEDGIKPATVQFLIDGTKVYQEAKYHPDGRTIKESIKYHNDGTVASVVKFAPTGKKRSAESFTTNNECRERRTYRQDGTLSQETIYHPGGRLAKSVTYDTAGQERTGCTAYRADGTKEAEIQFLPKGNVEQICTQFGSDGKSATRKTTSYRDHPHFIRRTETDLDESGQKPKAERAYSISGALVESTTFHSNGTRKSGTKYDQGRKSGEIEYSDSGVKLSESFLTTAGLPDKRIKYFRTDGTCARLLWYKDEKKWAEDLFASNGTTLLKTLWYDRTGGNIDREVYYGTNEKMLRAVYLDKTGKVPTWESVYWEDGRTEKTRRTFAANGKDVVTESAFTRQGRLERETEFWLHGRKDTERQFAADGTTIASERSYRVDGTLAKELLFGKDGKKQSETVFWLNGEKRSVTYFVDDRSTRQENFSRTKHKIVDVTSRLKNLQSLEDQLSKGMSLSAEQIEKVAALIGETADSGAEKDVREATLRVLKAAARESRLSSKVMQGLLPSIKLPDCPVELASIYIDVARSQETSRTTLEAHLGELCSMPLNSSGKARRYVLAAAIGGAFNVSAACKSDALRALQACSRIDLEGLATFFVRERRPEVMCRFCHALSAATLNKGDYNQALTAAETGLKCLPDAVASDAIRLDLQRVCKDVHMQLLKGHSGADRQRHTTALARCAQEVARLEQRLELHKAVSALEQLYERTRPGGSSAALISLRKQIASGHERLADNLKAGGSNNRANAEYRLAQRSYTSVARQGQESDKIYALDGLHRVCQRLSDAKGAHDSRMAAAELRCLGSSGIERFLHQFSMLPEEAGVQRKKDEISLTTSDCSDLFKALAPGMSKPELDKFLAAFSSVKATKTEEGIRIRFGLKALQVADYKHSELGSLRLRNGAQFDIVVDEKNRKVEIKGCENIHFVSLADRLLNRSGTQINRLILSQKEGRTTAQLFIKRGVAREIELPLSIPIDTGLFDNLLQALPSMRKALANPDEALSAFADDGLKRRLEAIPFLTPLLGDLSSVKKSGDKISIVQGKDRNLDIGGIRVSIAKSVSCRVAYENFDFKESGLPNKAVALKQIEGIAVKLPIPEEIRTALGWKEEISPTKILLSAPRADGSRRMIVETNVGSVALDISANGEPLEKKGMIQIYINAKIANKNMPLDLSIVAKTIASGNPDFKLAIRGDKEHLAEVCKKMVGRSLGPLDQVFEGVQSISKTGHSYQITREQAEEIDVAGPVKLHLGKTITFDVRRTRGLGRLIPPELVPGTCVDFGSGLRLSADLGLLGEAVFKRSVFQARPTRLWITDPVGPNARSSVQIQGDGMIKTISFGLEKGDLALNDQKQAEIYINVQNPWIRERSVSETIKIGSDGKMVATENELRRLMCSLGRQLYDPRVPETKFLKAIAEVSDPDGSLIGRGFRTLWALVN